MVGQRTAGREVTIPSVPVPSKEKRNHKHCISNLFEYYTPKNTLVLPNEHDVLTSCRRCRSHPRNHASSTSLKACSSLFRKSSFSFDTAERGTQSASRQTCTQNWTNQRERNPASKHSARARTARNVRKNQRTSPALLKSQVTQIEIESAKAERKREP